MYVYTDETIPQTMAVERIHCFLVDSYRGFVQITEFKNISVWEDMRQGHPPERQQQRLTSTRIMFIILNFEALAMTQLASELLELGS